MLRGAGSCVPTAAPGERRWKGEPGGRLLLLLHMGPPHNMSVTYCLLPERTRPQRSRQQCSMFDAGGPRPD